MTLNGVSIRQDTYFQWQYCKQWHYKPNPKSLTRNNSDYSYFYTIFCSLDFLTRASNKTGWVKTAQKCSFSTSKSLYLGNDRSYWLAFTSSLVSFYIAGNKEYLMKRQIIFRYLNSAFPQLYDLKLTSISRS